MPYIPKKQRSTLSIPNMMNAGHLNYCITMHVHAYLRQHGLSYQTLNDITGALENCKLEVYRRLTTDYEDAKIKENTDVFPYDENDKEMRIYDGKN